MLNAGDFVMAVLTQEGMLSAEAATRAARHAAEHRMPAPEAAVAIGAISPRDLAMARSIVAERPFVDLEMYEVDLRNAELLPRSAAEKHGVFPLFRLEGGVTVGMADPMDLAALDAVRQLLRAEVDAVHCEPEALRSLLDRAYSLTAGALGGPDEAVAAAEPTAGGEEPLVAAVNQILWRAAHEGASDVHLGPDDRELHLRYRIDGVLQPRQAPPLSSHPGLVQRLKVMANLDLTVTRRPQDGKFRFTHAGRTVDVRVSIIPTVTGENAVLRLLSGEAHVADLGDLGVPTAEAEALRAALERPHGMILATGPTGSGKTTTLYSCLKRLNGPDVNIMTIEDPVEIRLPLVRQVQVNPEIGMSFAGALRSILRQDPDVVLVGEIRDEETARIAVQAALTGHLVLSTLHTNDAAGATTRLRDLGVPGFAVSAAVLGVLAQRLVRRVCPDCAAPYEPSAALRQRFAAELAGGSAPRRGAGCGRCLGTGWRGRVGVYEWLAMTPAVQAAVEATASTEAVREAGRRCGMRPMWRDGIDKARLGVTTLEEVASVVALEVAETGVGRAAA